MEHKLRRVRIAELSPIAANQWNLWVKAEDESLPDFEPGQFCMLSLESFVDPLLPRPYAIVEKKDSMYRFIYRVDGKFTKMLSRQWKGASLQMLGPLGQPAPIQKNSGLKVFIAGGVGYSSLYPLFAYAKEQILFYGLRRDLDKIPHVTGRQNFYSTDDGSLGFKGRVHELLQLKKDLWKNAEAFYVCGPTPMMKAVYSVIPPEKSYYFLEESMGCGVGICMGCVVPTPDSPFPKRSCLEGPVFRGDRLQQWMQA